MPSGRRDTDVLLALFMDDAVVVNEGRTYHGSGEILKIARDLGISDNRACGTN